MTHFHHPDDEYTIVPVDAPPVRVVPVLSITEIAPALALYELFGFSPKHIYANYVVLRNGEMELHLTMDRSRPPGTIYLRVANVGEVHAAVTELPPSCAIVAVPLHEAHYAAIEFEVLDGAGNLLRVGQALGRREHR